MDNEVLFTVLVNQAADMDKSWRRMVQKYVYDPQKRDINETFNQDAKEWAQWHKIGVV